MPEDTSNANCEFPEPTFTEDEDEVGVMKNSSGQKPAVYTYGREFIPLSLVRMGLIPHPRKHLPMVKEMDIRSDDVFMCAYIKSGTHWTWETVKMLQKGVAEYENESKIRHMLEFISTEELARLQSPRLLNTHLLFESLPKGIKEKKTKVIFVYRNPKDLAVSAYHHIKAFGKVDGYDIGEWKHFLPSFMNKELFYHNTWVDYMRSFEKAFEENKDVPFLVISYEDMKKDQMTQVQRISKFLNLPCDDKLMNSILEKTQFDAMKSAKANVIELSDRVDAGKIMYRKGIVGDWKNWFTVAQNEQFNKFMKENSSNSFVYQFEI